MSLDNSRNFHTEAYNYMETKKAKPRQATHISGTVNAYHGRNLSRNQRLTRWGQPHLLHQSILQGKVITSV